MTMTATIAPTPAGRASASSDNASSRSSPRVRAAAEYGTQSTAIATMGAALPGAGVVGAKVYATVKGQFNFVIVLFSALTGEALAAIEAAVNDTLAAGFRTRDLLPSDPAAAAACFTFAAQTPTMVRRGICHPPLDGCDQTGGR